MRPRIAALLIDLSGTVHIGSESISGSVNAIKRLREAGIPFRFSSNTSKESTRALTERLKNMGIEVKAGELYTSLIAARDLVEQRKLRPYYLLSPSALEDFSSSEGPLSSKTDEFNPLSYDSVLIGLAPTALDYPNLNKAYQILTSSSKPTLLATHKALYFASSKNQLSLGPGPFVHALEVAAGVKSEVVGKPTRTFYERAMESLKEQIKGQEDGVIAVVGDDWRADLGGATKECGLWRVLVKTGKYRPGDEHKWQNQGEEVGDAGTNDGRLISPPDEVYDSLDTFVNSLIGGDDSTRSSGVGNTGRTKGARL
ncbi:hypothetical protein BOTBODRAFT_29028 [Botryobasidium botryosum FD-172 SS1]|uniref:Haloacid dehalogenase-like hydrolase domain-containing protein 2 n=1 Tax=Botryobasidium botryosum (strain FD-172 SS1) TaxID=930990 RepID=A0A067MSC7_BOTB1|nr:hypothetical protein BOTBODRAFT_29028 [Botryobasidium botryosum FD-172 SS1]